MRSKKFVIWKFSTLGYVATVVHYKGGSVDVATTAVDERALRFTKREAESLVAKLGGEGFAIWRA